MWKHFEKLIKKILQGSAMSLILQTRPTGQSSPQEIEEVRKLLETLEGKK